MVNYCTSVYTLIIIFFHAFSFLNLHMALTFGCYLLYGNLWKLVRVNFLFLVLQNEIWHCFLVSIVAFSVGRETGFR